MLRRRWAVVSKQLEDRDPELDNLWLYWTRRAAERECGHMNDKAFFAGLHVRFIVQDRRSV